MGDMTSVVYPVSGGLEDWAYGAGWDRTADATLPKCISETYPIDADFYNRSTTSHIATAVYLIEMDNSKNPPESSYGSRIV